MARGSCHVSELTGSKTLCIFEQWCAPGTGAPKHTHKVEEVLSVISGKVEVQLGDKIATLTQNESVVVPAGLVHGFCNVGDGELHVQAILACGYFEAIHLGVTRLYGGAQHTPIEDTELRRSPAQSSFVPDRLEMSGNPYAMSAVHLIAGKFYIIR